MEAIDEIYKRTGYFEKNGTNILLALVIVFISFTIIAYNSSQSVFKMVATNWVLNRCNPIFMPFAGIIMPIPGVTSLENVSENFNYCIQSDFSAIFSVIIMPIEFALYLTVESMDACILASTLLIQLFQMFQNLLGGILQELFDKVINAMVPMVVMSMNARDTMGKINGVMIAVVYTIMGIFNLTISGTSAMMSLVLDVIIMFIGVIVALMVIAIILVAFFFTGPLGVAVALVATGLAGVLIGFIILYEVLDSFTEEVFFIVNKDAPSVPSTSV